jgi:hypothetical protein
MARRGMLLLICVPIAVLGCTTVPASSPSQPAQSAESIDIIQLSGHREQSGTPSNDEAHSNAASGPDQKAGNATTKQRISLPLAIQMCITQNFRLHAGAERVRQAEADLVTASLIPNASLFTDYQLIPLQRVNINNQLGPPQADAIVTIPIDWLLFGKRVAAMQAGRLGIDVTSADYADLHGSKSRVPWMLST